MGWVLGIGPNQRSLSKNAIIVHKVHKDVRLGVKSQDGLL